MQSKVDVDSISETWLIKGAKSNTDKEKEMLADFLKHVKLPPLVWLKA